MNPANPQPILEHYGTGDLTERIALELSEAGWGAGPLEWSALAPLDQFHVRGLAATIGLADALMPEPGSNVLDVGCGLGGPARYLAAVRGCRVTGVDLSPSFVDVARMLAERTGLADRTTFVPGDALDLPFPDESFDHAWTQHVAMNIADRAGLYGSIHRVLKPGGRLAIYDVVAGSGEPLTYPVPWARGPETSFLLDADAMRAALRKAGFVEVAWRDTTEESLAWFAEQGTSPPPPFGLASVMGPDFPAMAANLARNLAEGRARLVQAVVRRS